MEVVVVGYNKFSNGQQYKVSSLVLDLQNLMCTEENTIAKSDGTIVSVPTPAQITRESKKRLKPSHERRVIAASLKYKGNLRNLEFSQEIVENDLHVTANPTMRISTCQFCTKCKRYTSCNVRAMYKLSSSEYMLSTMTPNVAVALKARVVNSMPLAPIATSDVVFGSIDKSLSNSNFVIHEASEVFESGGRNVIENMNFCVTFLSKEGKGVPRRERIWVTGTIMSDLVTHKNKKLKFVYDETINFQKGWSFRRNNA